VNPEPIAGAGGSAGSVPRRVAVTGARGFIGRHLVARLQARGDEVVTVSVRAPCEDARLADVFRRAETVVNLAGVVAAVREADYVAGNVDAARAIARAARDAGARLVHISSLAAAGPAPPAAPRGEDDPPAPITTYGRTKLDGERIVSATAGLRWTILRPGVVYGPRDRALLPLFRYAARGFLPLVGNPAAAYTFVYIDDMIRAIEAAIDRDAEGEVVFVGHATPVSLAALLDRIRALTGGAARIVRVPPALARAAAAAGDLSGALTGRPAPINSRRYAEAMSEGFVCRVDRLRDRLGVVAGIDLAEGLTRTADWYRREGCL